MSSRLPVRDVCRLNKREIDVLRLVGRGWVDQQITERLGIAKSTVESHIDKLHCKLYVHNRVQLALCAHRYGYVSLDEIDYGVTVERVRKLVG